MSFEEKEAPKARETETDRVARLEAAKVHNAALVRLLAQAHPEEGWAEAAP